MDAAVEEAGVSPRMKPYLWWRGGGKATTIEKRTKLHLKASTSVIPFPAELIHESKAAGPVYNIIK